MLPPRTFRPILRYFDAIDAIVAARLLRKRPWSELALTSLLCDLMDQDTEVEYERKRDLEWLRRKLASVAPLMDIRFEIETHEYPPGYERWVTQADLGLVLRFEDLLLGGQNWEKAFLLQAKRVYAARDGSYHLQSSYGGFDTDQHERARAINKHLGYELVRYLLYCPRPERLPRGLAEGLRHMRDANVQDSLFDGIAGLEMHSSLVRSGNTLEPGIVVASPLAVPATLGGTYSSLFSGCTPWAWFLTLWLTQAKLNDHSAWEGFNACVDSDLEDLMVRIVSGDQTAVTDMASAVEGLEDRQVPILPAHTMTVSISLSSEFDDEFRQEADRLRQ